MISFVSIGHVHFVKKEVKENNQAKYWKNQNIYIQTFNILNNNKMICWNKRKILHQQKYVKERKYILLKN